MPKSLDDNIEDWVCLGQILSCSHFQVNYKLNTHARWISNLLLCADWLLDSPYKNFCLGIRNPVISMAHRKEVPSLSLHNSSKLFICAGHEMIPRPGAYWILMEKYIHILLQLEVSNYHNKLQPVSRGHLCTDQLFATKLSYSWHGFSHLDQFLMSENSIWWPKTTFPNWLFLNM